MQPEIDIFSNTSIHLQGPKLYQGPMKVDGKEGVQPVQRAKRRIRDLEGQ